jgi:hypothetical protein
MYWDVESIMKGVVIRILNSSRLHDFPLLVKRSLKDSARALQREVAMTVPDG